MDSKDLGIVALKILGIWMAILTLGLILQTIGLYGYQPADGTLNPRTLLISQLLSIAVYGVVAMVLILSADSIGNLMFTSTKGPSPRLIRWEILSVALAIVAFRMVVGALPRLIGLGVDLLYFLGGERRELRSQFYSESGSPLVQTVAAVVLGYLIFKYSDKLARFWEGQQQNATATEDNPPSKTNLAG